MPRAACRMAMLFILVLELSRSNRAEREAISVVYPPEGCVPGLRPWAASMGCVHGSAEE